MSTLSPETRCVDICCPPGSLNVHRIDTRTLCGHLFRFALDPMDPGDPGDLPDRPARRTLAILPRAVRTPPRWGKRTAVGTPVMDGLLLGGRYHLGSLLGYGGMGKGNGGGDD